MKHLRYVPLKHDQQWGSTSTTVAVPVGARAIDVLAREGTVTLVFALPDHPERDEEREFVVACCRPGDGIHDLVNHDIPSDAKYIGTVSLHAGWLFCHVFEVEPL